MITNLATAASLWVLLTGAGAPPRADSLMPLSPDTVQVELLDEAPYFNPKRLRLPSGSSVVWKNRGTGLTHTIYMLGDDGPIRSGPLPPGQSWSHTFTGSAVIKVSCEIHPYMYGIVVVGNPSEQALAAVESRVQANRPGVESARILEFNLPIPHAVPGVLAVDREDNVWVTLGGGGWANINYPALSNFARLTLDGDISIFASPSAASGPSGLLISPDGMLYITELMAGSIARYAPSTKELEEFSIPTSPSWPTGLAVARDGALWFNETKGNKVGRMQLDGTMTEFVVPTEQAHPTGMVIDLEDNVWIAERDASKIARVRSDGFFIEYGLPTPAAKPAGMTVDSRNRVWFAEREGNRIGVVERGQVQEFELPNPGSAPFFLAVDQDDNIWFSEVYGDRIGVLTAIDHRFVEFSVPTPDAWPGGIAFDSQGNLWFTEQMGNKVGVMLNAPQALAEALARPAGTIVRTSMSHPGH